MTKLTQVIFALLIAAVLLGGYLVVAGNGSSDSPGDTPSGFVH